MIYVWNNYYFILGFEKTSVKSIAFVIKKIEPSRIWGAVLQHRMHLGMANPTHWHKSCGELICVCSWGNFSHSPFCKRGINRGPLGHGSEAKISNLPLFWEKGRYWEGQILPTLVEEVVIPLPLTISTHAIYPISWISKKYGLIMAASSSLMGWFLMPSDRSLGMLAHIGAIASTYVLLSYFFTNLVKFSNVILTPISYPNTYIQYYSLYLYGEHDFF